ncbi:hypothetical protein ACFSTI_15735 [Rhizorhabdus histidinilytica]
MERVDIANAAGADAQADLARCRHGQRLALDGIGVELAHGARPDHPARRDDALVFGHPFLPSDLVRTTIAPCRETGQPRAEVLRGMSPYRPGKARIIADFATDHGP